MAIYTSGDRPDTFQAQRGQERTPCPTLPTPPPPPPRAFPSTAGRPKFCWQCYRQRTNGIVYHVHNYATTATDQQLP